MADEFKDIITGVLLRKGSIRMNGRQALLSIQQTDEFIVNLLWLICNKYGLVNKKVKCLYSNKKWNVYIVLIN